MTITESLNQESRESIAKALEVLAADIRSGKTEVTFIEQTLPVTRYWANERWEYFRLDDVQWSLRYYNVDMRKEESARHKAYVEAHPLAMPSTT